MENILTYGKDDKVFKKAIQELQNQTETYTPKIINICENEGLLVTTNNKLFRLRQSVEELHLQYDDVSQIKTIRNGARCFLILCSSGNVYIFGSTVNGGLKIKNESSYAKPRIIDYFKDNNIFIRDIECCNETQFFISEGNDLYCVGHLANTFNAPKLNPNGQLTLVRKKVLSLYGGIKGRHCFVQDEDLTVYACGHNDYKQCGITGNSVHVIKVPLLSNVKKLDIVCTHTNCTALVDGYVYSAGYSSFHGLDHSNNLQEFTKIPTIQEIKFKSIHGGSSHFWAIAEDNTIYKWGWNDTAQLGTGDRTIKTPKKHALTGPLTESGNLTITCGPFVSIIFPSIDTGFNSEFTKFLKRQENCDWEVYGIKAHEIIVNCRSGDKDPNEIKSILQNFGEDKTREWIDWVYGGQSYSFSTIKEIAKKLEIQNVEKKTLEHDILLLEEDEDSKDFIILVKDPEEDDEEVEGGEDEMVEIPVHKIILQIRSGLFRDMFNLLSEKKVTNTVQDYSNKSPESLEILISYFYTNKLKLTADNDPQLTVEELEDAVEYYKLDKYSNLKSELEQIKNTYK
ncbi:hypothetical protein M0812_18665 [Anaeramoeba flamelloides]|uniref:BTB domain-containing protein n=1 Tax=Anaeramoeba flamelloides TaxID=1746091 RepID=A0AAV7Z3D4_9EUKA|nr:hypothetical protein M0812_18665 [Anaeramoeba flamelloides]|eukprot:Anaeramoba_flamelloidesa807688_277.p1 GENE.a807688_277~~a807688_277.p1  ORF type:complete len:568 (+),score=121.52 a807688_277:32-1735(+)